MTTTSPEALREAVERAEAWARIIERPAPDGDNSLKVAASVAEQHARDLRALLSALQEAREAVGPLAKAWGRSDRNAPYSTSPRIFPALDDFRRAAGVFRALSPGGADE